MSKIEEVINKWDKQAENLHNGVPKEENKCQCDEIGESYYGRVGKHFRDCPMYIPKEEVTPPTLTQLKDEMEKEFVKYLEDFCHPNGVTTLMNMKEFLSSHLQKTYEVAEKAGYERGRKEADEETSRSIKEFHKNK